jgi:phospho-N-acetylmuramoyl-pentapeptide-transferase
MNLNILKILIPAILTFFIGITITPFLTKIFYKYKMWKKNPRTESDTSEEFKKLHNTKEELNTPRVGGVVIWFSVVLCILIVFILSVLFPSDFTGKLNFLSRGQTLVPLGALVLASIIGLIDDFIQISGKGGFSKDSLSYRKIKIFSTILIGIFISLWFYYKLDVSSIHIPFGSDFHLGMLFIPFFVTVMLATFSTSVIDGMDGLSGGIMASVFTAYSVVAYSNNQIDLSTFCAVVSGGILAFLWFNITPARFYMGETGMMGLTVVLSVIAFLTDSVLFLPIIALPLVATSASNIIQMTSYKFFNKKRVFKIAPLHHHFEAIGWSRARIVMRYWIIGIIFAILGAVITIIGS